MLFTRVNIRPRCLFKFPSDKGVPINAMST
jgi:hypothetical protein